MSMLSCYCDDYFDWYGTCADDLAPLNANAATAATPAVNSLPLVMAACTLPAGVIRVVIMKSAALETRCPLHITTIANDAQKFTGILKQLAFVFTSVTCVKP